jgi:hypothetical protein
MSETILVAFAIEKKLAPGTKVHILQNISSLRHRKNRNGVITSVDGAYLMVRPSWCNWEVELYPHEVKAR